MQNGKSGQALAEMVVAMVVMIVLIAGLLHIARMAMAHTEAMHEARRQAGERAMQQTPTWANPAFILDWDPGPDGSAYSRDDTIIPAAPAEFTLVIPATAHPQALDQFLPGNPVSAIAANPSPQHEFHLVRGDGVRYIPVPPIIQHLVYDSETIDLRGEVWMTYTRGLY